MTYHVRIAGTWRPLTGLTHADICDRAEALGATAIRDSDGGLQLKSRGQWCWWIPAIGEE
ncbi:MAG TPA: hypothetical protein VNJ70_17960 [Thermoanaerobaculia bacterium]|nr:hypothetical protein [Thermoanaerobaculia bacterium]